MKNAFVKTWKSSIQPRKQRKYQYNAPQHIKSKLLGCHLSKELREKHGKRAMRVVTGDKVLIIKGNFKKKEGKVERVDVKNQKIYITGIEVIKKDGNKVLYPFRVANLIIVELNLNDKKRQGKLKPKVKSEEQKNG